MFYSTESDCSSNSNVRLIEQAFKALKHSISVHLEHENRLERMCTSWHQNWVSQCEQLRSRVEHLEARLAPWLIERPETPRLAVITHHEETN